MLKSTPVWKSTSPLLVTVVTSMSYGNINIFILVGRSCSATFGVLGPTLVEVVAFMNAWQCRTSVWAAWQQFGFIISNVVSQLMGSSRSNGCKGSIGICGSGDGGRDRQQQQGRGGSSYISHPKWHGSSFKVTTYGRQTSNESFNEADTSNNNNFSIYFFLYLSFFEIRPQGIMHISHRVLIICANEIQLNPDIIVEHLVLVIKLFWHSGYDYASSNSVLLPQKAAAARHQPNDWSHPQEQQKQLTSSTAHSEKWLWRTNIWPFSAHALTLDWW